MARPAMTSTIRSPAATPEMFCRAVGLNQFAETEFATLACPLAIFTIAAMAKPTTMRYSMPTSAH